MKINRRNFLKKTFGAGAAALAYSALSPFTGLMNSAAQAATLSNKTLVTIFLRGANDGLNTVVPYGDPHYYDLRPTIAIKEEDTIKLSDSNFFGLNPYLAELKDIYEAGDLAIFPASHNYSLGKSHFESQEAVCTGLTDKKSTGWMNRYLATQSTEALQAVSLSIELHELFWGPENVVTTEYLDSFREMVDSATLKDLQKIYSLPLLERKKVLPTLRNLGTQMFNDLYQINSALLQPYSPENGASYQSNDFAKQMRDAAHLIKHTGVKTISLNYGHFDAHVNQQGLHANRFPVLAGGLRAFYDDLGEKMDDVLVLLVTEFGRTMKENGAAGTDHGRASSWFAMGGSVRGGIYGEWPGLATEQLRSGRDLDHSIDIGDIITESLVRHLGVQDPASIFPDHNYKEIGYIL